MIGVDGGVRFSLFCPVVADVGPLFTTGNGSEGAIEGRGRGRGRGRRRRGNEYRSVFKTFGLW